MTLSQPPRRTADACGAQADAWLTVATLNTRGVPVTGSRLAARYQVIGEAFETCDADVVAFQEVFTYWLCASWPAGCLRSATWPTGRRLPGLLEDW
jgi:hypothetical protein